MTQSILNVSGVGKATVTILAKGGFKTVSDLANASVNQLALLSGFSDKRATQIIENANNLLELVNIEKALPSLVSKNKVKEITSPVTGDNKPQKVKKKKEKKEKKEKKKKKEKKDKSLSKKKAKKNSSSKKKDSSKKKESSKKKGSSKKKNK